jgi:uncharacterized protein YcfL
MRAFFILIAMLMIAGCASSDTVADRKTGQQLVCHKGHTRAVTTGDYFIHIDHGDSIGPCAEEK